MCALFSVHLSTVHGTSFGFSLLLYTFFKVLQLGRSHLMSKDACNILAYCAPSYRVSLFRLTASIDQLARNQKWTWTCRTPLSRPLVPCQVLPISTKKNLYQEVPGSSSLNTSVLSIVFQSWTINHPATISDSHTIIIITHPFLNAMSIALNASPNLAQGRTDTSEMPILERYPFTFTGEKFLCYGFPRVHSNILKKLILPSECKLSDQERIDWATKAETTLTTPFLAAQLRHYDIWYAHPEEHNVLFNMLRSRIKFGHVSPPSIAVVVVN